MKKNIILIVLLASSFTCFAQNTDSFEKFDIGPFEVMDEDHNYRLREGVTIPEYFSLKRPMGKNTFQTDIFFSLPGIGTVNTYGIDFVWKKKISDRCFLNIGIAAAIPSAKANILIFKRDSYEDNPSIVQDATASSIVSCYFGVPVSLEYILGRNSIVSGYFGFGLTPGMYFNGILDADIPYAYQADPADKNKKLNYSRSGFFLAPRIDLGIYAPIGRHYLRAGILLEYKIDLTDTQFQNRFKYGIGCFMPGMSIGLAF